MSTKRSIENPYRQGGCYHAITETLVKMGLNKPHRYEIFLRKLKAGWEGFEEWASKEKRNAKTGKSADARILQNVRVLQRVKDFGKPLLVAGAVIDLAYDSRGVLTICLDTKSRKPTKPGRAPKTPPAAPRAKAKGKTVSKPTRVKKAAHKPSVKSTEAVQGDAAAENSAKAGTNATNAE